MPKTVVGPVRALVPVVEARCGGWPKGAKDLNGKLITKITRRDNAITALRAFAKRRLYQGTDDEQRGILEKVLTVVPVVGTQESADFNELLREKVKEKELKLELEKEARDEANDELTMHENPDERSARFTVRIQEMIQELEPWLSSAEDAGPAMQLLEALKHPGLGEDVRQAVRATTMATTEQLVSEIGQGSSQEVAVVPTKSIVPSTSSAPRWRSLSAKRPLTPSPQERLLECLHKLGVAAAKGAPKLQAACEALREVLA